MTGVGGQDLFESDGSRGDSALLSFEFENVRSFRDLAELSMVGSHRTDDGVVRSIVPTGSRKPLSVLPVAGIFGANASGKSTALRGLVDMRRFVLGSFRNGVDGSAIPRTPFLLDRSSRDRESRFAVDLVLDGIRWQYGFGLTDHEIMHEYAFYFPNGRQAMVFDREGDRFKFGRGLGGFGRNLEALCRRNSLLLSVAGAAPESSISRLFEWFSQNLIFADINSRDIRTARTLELLEDEANRERVLHLLRAADLGIAEIEVERVSVDPEMRDRIERAMPIIMGIEGDPDSELPLDSFVHEYVRFRHCADGGCETLESDDESTGTLVWLGVIGSILDALDNGTVLLADELDSSLHPYLVQRIIGLFQDPTTNRRAAQLIFNAHDMTILGEGSRRVLSRDQIWFAQKGPAGATTLYPLTEFNPRKDDAIRRRYLQGRYGAVPSVDGGLMVEAAHSVHA